MCCKRKYERPLLLFILYSSSIMSKKGGVQTSKSIRLLRQSTRKAARPYPSEYHRYAKLKSIGSYKAHRRAENRRSRKAQRKIERAQAEAHREIERFARRARGENSDNDDAPHASHAVASVAENRSMRAAIRSLAASAIGEQLSRASTRTQRAPPGSKMSDK